MHYVDEGSGEPVVFVHGNPAWSFEFRHLITGLRSEFRCVAPDHIGFGLSSRSDRKEDHHPAVHAEAFAALLDDLGLQRHSLAPILPQVAELDELPPTDNVVARRTRPNDRRIAHTLALIAVEPGAGTAPTQSEQRGRIGQAVDRPVKYRNSCSVHAPHYRRTQSANIAISTLPLAPLSAEAAPSLPAFFMVDFPSRQSSLGGMSEPTSTGRTTYGRCR